MLIEIDGALTQSPGAGGAADIPLNRGFLYGDTVVETCLISAGKVPGWPEHLHRLLQSVAACGLELASHPAELSAAVQAIAAALGSRLGTLRVMIVADGPLAELRRSSPSLGRRCLTAAPLEGQAWIDRQHRGIRLRSVQGRSVTPGVAPGPAKGLPGAAKIGQLTDAQTRAHTDDYLFVGSDGRIAETSFANIFVRGRDGTWLTPRADGTIFPGLTRRRVLSWLGEVGIEVQETDIDLSTAARASAMVLTSSVSGIVPASHLDDQPFDLERGDISDVRAVQARFRQWMGGGDTEACSTSL